MKWIAQSILVYANLYWSHLPTLFQWYNTNVQLNHHNHNLPSNPPLLLWWSGLGYPYYNLSLVPRTSSSISNTQIRKVRNSDTKRPCFLRTMKLRVVSRTIPSYASWIVYKCSCVKEGGYLGLGAFISCTVGCVLCMVSYGFMIGVM